MLSCAAPERGNHNLIQYLDIIVINQHYFIQSKDKNKQEMLTYLHMIVVFLVPCSTAYTEHIIFEPTLCHHHDYKIFP